MCRYYFYIKSHISQAGAAVVGFERDKLNDSSGISVPTPLRAERAGVREGDQILAINGAVVKPRGAAAALAMAAVGGAEVELRVLRTGIMQGRGGMVM